MTDQRILLSSCNVRSNGQDQRSKITRIMAHQVDARVTKGDSLVPLIHYDVSDPD